MRHYDCGCHEPADSNERERRGGRKERWVIRCPLEYNQPSAHSLKPLETAPLKTALIVISKLFPFLQDYYLYYSTLTHSVLQPPAALALDHPMYCKHFSLAPECYVQISGVERIPSIYSQ